MGCLKLSYCSDKISPKVSELLGSGTWITYTDGSAIQHLHYLPDKKLRFFSSLAFGNEKQVFHYTHCLRRFGEEQIDQRLTSFNSRYTFSAKEKDIETGYSYFGARYYTSDLSIWLSVDPLSDKYPNLSPYCYAANNPIKLIDPNGRDIVPCNGAGEDAIEFFLSKFSKSIQKKVFGLKKITGFDKESGIYPVYTSSDKNSPLSEEDFNKALGRKGKKMSESERKESYAFYQALTSDKQYKVEGMSPSVGSVMGDVMEEGSSLVPVVPNYAPREVNNNKLLMTDLGPNYLCFNKIFDPSRQGADSDNIFGEGFNFYKNYVKNPNNPNDYKTAGVIILDVRKLDWKNNLGKAFRSIMQ